MPENLLIHICVHIFLKIKDLTYTSKSLTNYLDKLLTIYKTLRLPSLMHGV